MKSGLSRHRSCGTFRSRRSGGCHHLYAFRDAPDDRFAPHGSSRRSVLGSDRWNRSDSLYLPVDVLFPVGSRRIGRRPCPGRPAPSAPSGLENPFSRPRPSEPAEPSTSRRRLAGQARQPFSRSPGIRVRCCPRFGPFCRTGKVRNQSLSMMPSSADGSAQMQTQRMRWRNAPRPSIRSITQQITGHPEFTLRTLGDWLGEEPLDCRPFLPRPLQSRLGIPPSAYVLLRKANRPRFSPPAALAQWNPDWDRCSPHLAAMPRILQLTDSISRLGGGVDGERTRPHTGTCRFRQGQAVPDLGRRRRSGHGRGPAPVRAAGVRTFPRRRIGPAQVEPRSRRLCPANPSPARFTFTAFGDRPAAPWPPPIRPATLDRLAPWHAGTMGHATGTLETTDRLALLGRRGAPGGGAASMPCVPRSG